MSVYCLLTTVYLRMLTLADLYEAFTKTRPERAAQIAIPHVTIDSRQVQTGSLFVALQGERRDGHEFISDAITRGAAAIIAEARGGRGLGPNVHLIDSINTSVAGLQPSPPTLPSVFIVESSVRALQQLAAFYRRKFKCETIGITGSVGKSSTKELIAAVLRQRFGTLKSEGNLNNEIGLPLTLLQLNETYERAILEMGMYALGEITTLCEIAQPRIGVVTNVGPTHLERLGTIERIAQAKAELVQALPRDGCAILNGDDPRVIAMKNQTRARVFCYGLDSHCDLWADAIESLGLEGIAFTLHHGSENLRVRIPLLGRHSVHTALAATSVGLIEKLSWDEILRGLRDESAQLRLIAVPAENGAMILDDTYNASPASSLAALNLLAELDGRKIAVLGDMLELGAEETRAHQIVGGRAAQIVDALIAVGARGKWIGDAARDAGLSSDKIFSAEDNTHAIEILRAVMRAGDLVLIKGSRGMQMEEI
ncbi:MAG: UDP-N-acetylmuramoyl-tripeptide--D-alanyl-D-alanine ligase, partial [Anaerolineales bacterium]|nr:UDP-N-acetylmuramoyl-tripeptide--D-alanyl-D-alanine ligase [Anaerolineales bacterium]